MQNVYSIATRPAYFQDLLNKEVCAYELRYQARPGTELPIMLQDQRGIQLTMATWGLRISGRSTPVTHIHMSRILKERPFNMLLRRQRCAVPANCFIVKKEETRLVRLLKQRIFCMGGIYQIEKQGGNIRIRFGLLQTEPADMLQPYCNTMPVCFTMDRRQQWVGSDHIGDIMHRADRASQLWYDHFKVSEKVLENNLNERVLLTPLSLSPKQIREREAALAKVNIDELRANTSSKN